MSKRVALVLGSGAARGYAHVGVIRELIKRGYEISRISASSMGALVGGSLAAGKFDEMCEWGAQLDKMALIKMLDVSLNKTGLIRGDRIFNQVREVIGDRRIEDLPIPFTAVATNLSTRKEVWFRKGDLVTAMRASCAIPSIFHPVVMQGHVLVDGSVLNPLPLSPAVSTMADIVIAVDLFGMPVNESHPDEQKGSRSQFPGKTSGTEPEEADAQHSMMKKLLGRINPQKLSQKTVGGELDQLGLMEVFNQSMELMQESLTRYKIAGYVPDVNIEVPRNICSFYEFHRFEELAHYGQELAVDALDRWESGLDREPVMLLEANMASETD